MSIECTTSANRTVTCLYSAGVFCSVDRCTAAVTESSALPQVRCYTSGTLLWPSSDPPPIPAPTIPGFLKDRRLAPSTRGRWRPGSFRHRVLRASDLVYFRDGRSTAPSVVAPCSELSTSTSPVGPDFCSVPAIIFTDTPPLWISLHCGHGGSTLRAGRDEMPLSGDPFPDPTGVAGTMDDAVEASAQRVRNHLRRPFPGGRTLRQETAGNTVSEI